MKCLVRLRQACVLATAAVLLAGVSLQAQTDPPTLESASAAFAAALRELRAFEGKSDARKTTGARARLARAERDYLDARSRNVLRGMGTEVPAAVQRQYLADERARLTSRRIDLGSAVEGNLPGRLERASSESERVRILADEELLLRTLRMDEEVNERFFRVHFPNRERTAPLGQVDKSVESTTARMDRLLNDVGVFTPSEFGARVDMAKRAKYMVARAEFEGDVGEYSRLAGGRSFTHSETGELLPPHLQNRVRANAGRALRERLEARQTPMSGVEWLADQVYGYRDLPDIAGETASRLRAEESNNVEDLALRHLTGMEVDYREYYGAMALEIQGRKAAVAEYFDKEYLPAGDLEKDSRFKMWANMGMGSAYKLIHADGEEGVATVRRKIDAMNTQADAASDALLRAMRANSPSDLSTDDRRMLQQFGYIETDDAGRDRFAVPTGRNRVSQATNIDLPAGSVWLDALDAINVKNAVVTGGGIVSGAGGASLAQKFAQFGGLSERSVVAAKIVGDLGASVLFDGAVNYVETGEANLDEALLHNATMVGVGAIGSRLRNSVLEGNTTLMEALDQSSNKTIWRELVGGDREVQAAKFVSESLGLASESAIETAYQAFAQSAAGSSAMSPEELKEAFLGNLMQGALARNASKVLQRPFESIDARNKAFVDALPEYLRSKFRNNPEAIDGIVADANASQEHADGAMARFNASLDNADGGTGLFGRKKRIRTESELLKDKRTADAVIESLNNGELNYLDLSVVEEQLGSAAKPLLTEIGKRRTKWAYGVDNPSDGDSQIRALDKLDQQMESRRREIGETEQSPEARESAIKDLEAQHQSMRQQIEGNNFENTPDGARSKKFLSDARSELFSEAVMSDGIGPEVKRRALQELEAEYRRRMETARFPEALDRWRAEEAVKINEAQLIAPGSAKPTSDIDRSWSDPRVRDAMKSLQRDRLMLEREGVRGIGPTTAKAWDLNEYFNVLPGIEAGLTDRNHPERGFADLPVRVRAADGTLVVEGVTHDDYVAGNSRAAAMAQMDAAHRESYEREVLESATTDAKRKQYQDEFAIADHELALSQQALDRQRKIVADRYGLPENSPETDLYARDELYGRRMLELARMDQRIAAAEPGGQSWKELQAVRERLMNRANRDGIEAYTDAAGLDVVVRRMQGKKNTDGSTKSVNDLWRDGKFNNKPGGDLEHLSDRQLDNMLNDQVMMVTEHLNGFKDGHETQYQTAKALAKYGQRAALVEKMKGADLPEGHPMRTLYDAASRLMAHKGDSDAMLEALAGLAGEGGSTRDGLKALVAMVETAMPGLDGYTDQPSNTVDAPGQAPRPLGFSSARRYRNWLHERDRRFEEGGQEAVDQWVARQEERVAEEGENLIAEEAELRALGGDFLPEDFREARSAMDELEASRELMRLTPKTDPPTEVHMELLRQAQAKERELQELRNKRGAYVREHGAQPDNPDLIANLREQEFLEEREGVLEDVEPVNAELIDVLESPRVDRPSIELLELGPSDVPGCQMTGPVAGAPCELGVLELNNGAPFVVGEAMTLGVGFPEDPSYDLPWVGMYDSDGSRPTWQRTDGRSPLTFTAPATIGNYEFRVYGDDAGTILLDRMPFRTHTPPVEDALSLPRATYVVGEEMTLGVTLPGNRYYALPWVGMYDSIGNRPTWQRTDRQTPLTFAAPATIGDYEFRVFDRDSPTYVMDSIAFSVYAPPVPDALSLNETLFIVGEEMTLGVTLPDNRFYGLPWVGMYDSEGNRPTWQRTDRKTPLTFAAPATKGDYEFRVFDRDNPTYVMDSIAFSVHAPPVPDALSLNGTLFIVGEAMTLGVTLPDNRFYGLPWVGMYDSEGNRPTWQRTDRRTPLTFAAPATIGDYEFRVFDRDNPTYVMDSIAFRVHAPPVEGALSLSRTTFSAGAEITLGVTLPDNRFYSLPWVGMYDSAGNRPTWQRTDRRSPLTFTAPDTPGVYEFRVFDRDNPTYVMDTIAFRVIE